MTYIHNNNKVPENIQEAAADKTEAHHIYRNFLKSRQNHDWFDMCRDAQKRMAPQQFYFRYLMPETNGHLTPDIELASPRDLNMTRRDGQKVKITDMWTLNVSGGFFAKVGAAVESNDWSIPTWEHFYLSCQVEARMYEDTNGFFRDFKSTPQYPRFVEAKLLSLMNQNRAGVANLIGLKSYRDQGIIHNFAYPQLLRYGATGAYLQKKGSPHARHSLDMAQIAYRGISRVQTMPFTFDEFVERIATVSL